MFSQIPSIFHKFLSLFQQFPPSHGDFPHPQPSEELKPQPECKRRDNGRKKTNKQKNEQKQSNRRLATWKEGGRKKRLF